MNSWRKLGLIAVLLIVGSLLIFSVQEPPNETTAKKKIYNDYRIYALPLPEIMDFAGEPVPLDKPDIRERMDRELLVNAYWQSNGLLIFKRAIKFFHIFVQLFKVYNLSVDIKYLSISY